jgi:L-ascorbate metabolism protein UlaG (beta-lactamase superfamily)
MQADTLPTSAGDLVIQPIHHASLVLSHKGVTIYLDPVGGAKRYEGLPRPTLILLTHEHGDHFDLPTLNALIGPATPIIGAKVAVDLLEGDLKNRATIIAQGQTIQFEHISIEAIPAHNLHPDRLKFHPKGVGNGYILTFADQRVYVSGDTEDTPEMLGLKNIDIAFLPMDGHYTMTGPQAASAAKAFKPKIVYPFHYGQGGQTEIFARELEGSGIQINQRNWYEEV